MEYLDELCDAGNLAFPKSSYSLHGQTALERARVREAMTVVDELNGNWNAVRLFGTGAGPMSIPAAAKESLRWVKRGLETLNRWWADRDMSTIRKGGGGQITMADIVVFQFLDFIKECYGQDLTVGTGDTVRDVYGREVQDDFKNLSDFYQAFRTRDSAQRVPALGELPTTAPLKAMTTWADGIWSI